MYFNIKFSLHTDKERNTTLIIRTTVIIGTLIIVTCAYIMCRRDFNSPAGNIPYSWIQLKPCDFSFYWFRN